MSRGPKGQKRPRDTNKLAKLMVDILTGEVEEPPRGGEKRDDRRHGADAGEAGDPDPRPFGQRQPEPPPANSLRQRVRRAFSISWSGKRNFVGRDWRAISAAECGRTAGIRFADRDTPH